MKKVVLKLDIHDGKTKQKAMKAASRLLGIDSIAVDMKDKKLTVIGNMDPVTVVSKLKKVCATNIESVESVEPAKETEEKKKDEPKKAEEKKKDPKDEISVEPLKAYMQYPPTHYYVITVEHDHPNLCAIF